MTAIALGATVFAGDSGSDNDDLKFRIRDEIAPPGGIVQMKVESYEVTPISGGRPGFSFDSAMFADAEGFDMFVDGELAGAAVIDGSRVALSYATNGASTTDYPVLTVSMRIRPDAAIGAKTVFALDPQSTWHISPTGNPLVASRLRPGTVTVGGSVSITDVVPGAGVWPAGTIVSVRGIGFNSRTRLRVDDVETRSVRFISSTEMRFTLAETAELRGVRLRAENSDFRSEYYAYMRGTTTTVSSRALLAATEPIFSVNAAHGRDARTVPVVERKPVRGAGASESDAGRRGGWDCAVRWRRRAAVSVVAHAGAPATPGDGAVRAPRRRDAAVRFVRGRQRVGADRCDRSAVRRRILDRVPLTPARSATLNASSDDDRRRDDRAPRHDARQRFSSLPGQHVAGPIVRVRPRELRVQELSAWPRRSASAVPRPPLADA